MKEGVRGHLSEAVSVYEDRPREQWIFDFPAQVALTGSQIWWNNDMELVFKRLEEGFESALKDYNKKQVYFMLGEHIYIEIKYNLVDKGIYLNFRTALQVATPKDNGHLLRNAVIITSESLT